MAVCMLLALFPAEALADTVSGDIGTDEDPSAVRWSYDDKTYTLTINRGHDGLWFRRLSLEQQPGQHSIRGDRIRRNRHREQRKINLSIYRNF